MRRLLLLTCFLLACSSTRGADSLYAPTENMIEVLAVLRLHINDDTYRFPPARDFTGKNIYRAVLSRTEALEALHAEKFRSGYLVDVLLFTKGRALERITEYGIAARHYERVIGLDSPLRDPAYIAKKVCERLQEASEIQASAADSPGEAMSAFDRRVHRLEQLAEEVEGTHYAAIVEEEIERADMARARYFAARGAIEPWLDVIALQQYQHLVQRHSESKLRNRHLLDLADQYAALARQYTGRFPPISLGFDPATFDEYAFGATRLYESVSRRDGAIEKIEASRKLEAFLAFTLQVYDEKVPR